MNRATWMYTNVDLFTDQITGEVNEAALAEACCEEYGIPLEPDDTAPDIVWKKADQIARAHEVKTGARPARINPAIGEFMNHVDSNFQFPKVTVSK